MPVSAPPRRRVLSRNQYLRYIEGPEFEALSLRAKKRDGFRCRICGSSLHLNAHHITYQHLGMGGELELADLTTLCREHHSMFHSALAEAESLPEPPPELEDEPTWDDLDAYYRMIEDDLPSITEPEPQRQLKIAA